MVNPKSVEALQAALIDAPLLAWGFSRVGEEPLRVDWCGGVPTWRVSGKTYRAASSSDECDGTANPNPGWEDLVRDIALTHGFKLVCWSPIEKGWGEFIFDRA